MTMNRIIAKLLLFSLLFVTAASSQTSSSNQKVVLIGKFSKNSQLGIIRTDGSLVKGKLIGFTETSVILSSKRQTIEIPYTEIKKIEERKNIGRLIIGISAVGILILLPFLIGGA